MLIKKIYSDNSLCIFRKPSNLHTLPGKESTPSLLSLISKEFPDCINTLKDNGLVQRLDYETSGLIIMAKREDCFHDLKLQFAKHLIEKKYYALCEGILKKEMEISGYLGSRYRGSQIVSFSATPKKRFLYASVSYKPVKYFQSQDLTLIEAKTFYGRRHVVRLLASELGHPLLGDSIYGAKRTTKEEFPDYEIPKFLLDAFQLKFRQATQNDLATYSGDLPEYLVKLLHNESK